MKKAAKKIISNILCVMLLFLNCSILISAAAENVSEQSAVLQSGIYRLKNAGSYQYMTVSSEDCFSGHWIGQNSNIVQSEAERSQLFKITYIGTYDGEDCYSIRPMVNSGYVIGCPYPEYTNIAELHSVFSDDYNVLGEENLWYISTDGNYYKLKNKYMGECYYELYGEDYYINNAFLCTYGGYNEIMYLDYMSGEDEAFEQWEIIPYTTDMECIEITNPISKLPVNSAYDFDAVAYSSEIGRNGPMTFSVINISGSATINSVTGVCNALSVGEIRVVLTYGDVSHSYDITIESAEPDFDSEKEYYFLSIYEGL
ncbi:MAG: hypothetical protein IJX27_00040, partial [Clostridia bacterium]|nr:hypothetical protein [Clostridia bacterium]